MGYIKIEADGTKEVCLELDLRFGHPFSGRSPQDGKNTIKLC